MSLAVVVFAGCSQHRYDVADPVVGPAPPRKHGLEAVAMNDQSRSELELVSYSPDEPIPMTEVVARVNGTPILAGQVLQPFAGKLNEASKQLPPSEIRKAQEMLLQKHLPAQIEQTLMVDAVKSKLQQEQLDAINGQLDEFFQLEVERLKNELQVPNAAQLEAKLQAQGMSLVSLREAFGDRQLASEYVRGRMGDDSPLTRADLLQEYQRRKEEFALPEQIKWQQLQVSTIKHGSRAQAEKVLQQALAELQQGADFTEVIKRYSDGPLKEQGGHWDWTQPSSIANPAIREALSQLQVGQFSQTLENGAMLQVVKVTGHKPASYTPFEEVQEKIRGQLSAEAQQEKAKQIIAELKRDAVIETIFDENT